MEYNFDFTQATFSFFEAGITNIKPTKTVTLQGVLKLVNSFELQDITYRLRQIPDEKQQKVFKSQHLPFVTFSGTFSQRGEAHLLKHSGLMCFDIDNLDGLDEVNRVKTILNSDPTFETLLAFTSPRGSGIKWITHIDLSRGPHKTWYSAIRNYLFQTYGIVTDAATSNVASACFLCSDPHMIIHKDIEIF